MANLPSPNASSTPTSIKTSSTNLDSLPSPPVQTAYMMTYRVGIQPHCEKGFMHVGDLRSAIVRAREHCERMGYTFKFCRPLIVDLDEDEKQLRTQI